jgi:hypothetical protein
MKMRGLGSTGVTLITNWVIRLHTTIGTGGDERSLWFSGANITAITNLCSEVKVLSFYSASIRQRPMINAYNMRIESHPSKCDEPRCCGVYYSTLPIIAPIISIVVATSDWLSQIIHAAWFSDAQLRCSTWPSCTVLDINTIMSATETMVSSIARRWDYESLLYGSDSSNSAWGCRDHRGYKYKKSNCWQKKPKWSS